MQLRQQRRRRVWPDDSTGPESAAGAPRAAALSTRTKSPLESYTAQARRDEQLRLTDLVPIRKRTLGLLFGLGLLPLAAVEGLYWQWDLLARHIDRGALGALDLADRGSLAAWYCGLLLSVTGLVAVLIFSLRRHRIDDYRGRYRVWIWAALAWLVVAINQTSRLDDLMHALSDQAAAALGLSPAWLWTALWLTAALAGMVRLSFELRRSKGALVLAWLAASSWLAGAGSGTLVSSETPLAAGLLGVAGRVLGQLTMLLAHLVYARYVLLDAHGQLPAADAPAKRAKPAARRRPAADEDRSAEPARPAPARTDLDPPDIVPTAAATIERRTAPVAAPGPPRVAVAVSEADDEDLESETDETRGMSRAERKKLRRQQRAERRNAA